MEIMYTKVIKKIAKVIKEINAGHYGGTTTGHCY